jgi:hypothetical protein
MVVETFGWTPTRRATPRIHRTGHRCDSIARRRLASLRLIRTSLPESGDKRPPDSALDVQILRTEASKLLREVLGLKFGEVTSSS